MQEKPLAVIIKGNPKYTQRPKIKPLADEFYLTIKKMLELKGFNVIFDDGKPFTLPDRNAAVWVAHSRGIDRLRFAKDHTKTIALETNDNFNGMSAMHYELSENDKRAIQNLTLN